jgi:hypothetical protein
MIESDRSNSKVPAFIYSSGRYVEANMSAMEKPSPGDRSKEERLKSFLKQKASDGEMYFKSKFIADEVGLSPKEIGALMVKLKDSTVDLNIEKWSYTSATTWRVEPA